jgi:hypothetical protein
MNRKANTATRTLILLAVVTAANSLADDFELDWWTIDGGGEMWTTGGDFELSGTIGQPDASAAVLTGGDFELTGGFWTRAGGRELPVVYPESVEPLDEIMEESEPQPGPP